MNNVMRFASSLSAKVADLLTIRRSLIKRASPLICALPRTEGSLDVDGQENADDLNRWDDERRKAAAARDQVARRNARRRASALGLAYWPALLPNNRGSCDPRAFVAAEAVLQRRHGGWNPATGQHGGWDSHGHHGVCPGEVFQYWRAAGCRDSPKFRFQVAQRVWAKKGDSLPWLRHRVRGQRWFDVWKWAYPAALSSKAIAALGRLSPELRHAALRGVADVGSKIRIRHLNWAEVARIQALRVDPSDRAQALRAQVLPARAACLVRRPARRTA